MATSLLEERHELIFTHLIMAEKIAAHKSRSVPASVQLDELKSAAVLGLVDAASRFNGNMASFKAYAIIKINGAILDYLREVSWGARHEYFVPVSLDRQIDDSGYCLGDCIEDYRAAPRKDCFDDITKHLSAIGKRVIYLYYVEKQTMKEIGRKVGMSEQKISKLLAQCEESLSRKWDKERLCELLAA